MNTNDTIIINPVNTSGVGVNLNDVVIPSTYSASTLSTSSRFSVLIDGDCTISVYTSFTMYYFARDHIPRYNRITTYPNDPEYNPNTNGVTNFSYAFYGLSNCKDTINSIMNRFNWNSCTDMSSAFYSCYNITGSIPYIPNSVTNMKSAFSSCQKLTGSIPDIPNSVTDMYKAFSWCINLTGSIPNIPNSVTNMSNAFSYCYNLTGSIPNIPNSVTDMSGAFYYCYNLTGSIPNIPNSVTDMSGAFYNCSSLSSSNVYIHSNNISNATNCFADMNNTMNIYVHANTTTYNSFYRAMGGTYNSRWKCYLKTF